MIVLCTYDLRNSEATDLLDVAQAHQLAIIRRRGEWELFESPDLRQQRQGIRRVTNLLDVANKPFSGHERLTTRERETLAAVVHGASNKEIAREHGISPRTVEFHRANIMQKVEVRNLAELITKVIS